MGKVRSRRNPLAAGGVSSHVDKPGKRRMARLEVSLQVDPLVRIQSACSLSATPNAERWLSHWMLRCSRGFAKKYHIQFAAIGGTRKIRSKVLMNGPGPIWIARSISDMTKITSRWLRFV